MPALHQLKQYVLSRKVLCTLSLLLIAGIVGVLRFHSSTNQLITSRFEGELLHLPTVVYARTMTLKTGDEVDMQEVINELNSLSYYHANNPSSSGEYTTSGSTITFVRRPFEFPSGDKVAQKIQLQFHRTTLISITDLDSDTELGIIELEPKMMGMLDNGATEHRIYHPYSDMPEPLIKALLLTEDRAFFEHDGVSVSAIVRAFFVNLKAGRTVQGGSTLTQQLTKNLFLSNERRFSRKIQEAYMALLIDRRYSKEAILDTYLNQVYLAQNGAEGVHGFGLGSQYYFNQPLQELRLDQYALLVGLIKGPSYYNPWRFPERALRRRNTVLQLMRNAGYIEQEEYEAASARDLDIQTRGQLAKRRPAYFALIQQELEQHLGNSYKAGTGVRIFTTLDPQSQAQAESSITHSLPDLEATAGVELQAAMVVADHSSGGIRAIIGSRNPGYPGFNHAIDGKRQIGSIVKPAVYLAALAQPEQYQLATSLQDTPLTIEQSHGEDWTPRNFDRRFRGQVPLYEALAKSHNIPTINLGMAIGLETVQSTLVQLGLEKSSIPLLPSMLLGAFEQSPLEMTQVYQSIANLGKTQPLYAIDAITDNNNQLLYLHQPTTRSTITPQAAWLTLNALQHTATEGTARGLGQLAKTYQLAGKTGTTDNNRDSWYVGIDGREVVTVWLGRDDNRNINLTGSTGALPVYRNYITRREPLTLTLALPEGIQTANYARLKNGTLTQRCSGTNLELSVWVTESSQNMSCSGDEVGKFIKRLFNW
ncbi:penicillin-binding protein 1B [Thaumasiovibrio sp. DFM-14]|uniref:penicillin-binding protein 1B n=1 Tax=Thaumasiovibrio sp. DFM-14 TaxID=3384792 RepID=UPI0039A31228